MYFYLIALIILLAGLALMGVWAIAASLQAPGKSGNLRANLFGAALAGCACGLGLLGSLTGDWGNTSHFQAAWGLPFGSFSLALDALSRIFLLPVFGLGLVCAISGQIALRHERASEHNLAAHWFFYLMLMAGMAVVLCARDTVLFLIAWEVMSLAPFFLIDFNDRDSKVRDAAWIYLTAAHLGAVCLIAFLVLFWQTSGTSSLQPLSMALDGASPPWLSSVMFLLAVAGFGAKAGIAPLHVWLPEAHPAAPSHVSALLSGAMINVGLYGIIRAIWLLCPATSQALSLATSAPAWWGWTILIIGLCTAFSGVIKALGQGNLKRLLAYSSVENMGLMFIGLGAGMLGLIFRDPWIAVPGFCGCLLHMLNHAWFKGLLFLCAGEILHATGTVRMELLGGLQKKLPMLGVLFFIGALAIACLPPLAGFTGEFLLAMGLANGAGAHGVERQLGLLLALGLVALVSGLAAALYVKAYGIIFSGTARTGFATNPHPCDIRNLWPLWIPALAVVAGGLFAPACFAAAASACLAGLPFPADLLPGLRDAANTAQAWMWRIAVASWSVILLCLALYALRKLLPGNRLSRHATWGCGYQSGSARIQYTDASFSEPLARIFGSLMGIRLHGEKCAGIFPRQSSLGISAPDRIRELVFQPLFEAIARAADACKIIQHGKIHLYIVYILATLIGLLLWGLRP